MPGVASAPVNGCDLDRLRNPLEFHRTAVGEGDLRSQTIGDGVADQDLVGPGEGRNTRGNDDVPTA
jgi:hypothetical protein